MLQQLQHCQPPLRVADPDDVICTFSAFGTGLRTPMTLFPRISSISGVFQGNSGYAVRWHPKSAIFLGLESSVSDRCFVCANVGEEYEKKELSQQPFRAYGTTPSDLIK